MAQVMSDCRGWTQEFMQALWEVGDIAWTRSGGRIIGSAGTIVQCDKNVVEPVATSDKMG